MGLLFMWGLCGAYSPSYGGAGELRAQPRGAQAAALPDDLHPEARAALLSLEARLGKPPRLVTRPEARASGGQASGGQASGVQASGGQASGGPQSRVVWMGGFEFPVPGATAGERAEGFLSAHGAALGIRAPVRPVVKRVIPISGGAAVRFGLEIHGLPVLGAGAVVTLQGGQQGGQVTSAAGGVGPLRATDGPQPVLEAALARGLVERATGRRVYRVLGLGYLVRDGEARLVWRMDQYARRPPQRFLLAVDAADGAILSVGRGFSASQGYVYDPSPLVAGGVYVTRPLSHLLSEDRLTGQYAKAWQCGDMTGGYDELPCQNKLQVAAPTDGEGNYFHLPQEPSLTDTFAEVQAYYHLTEFNRFLEESFGFVWRCAGRQSVDVMVNMDYPNAFYGDADGDPDACEDISLGEDLVDFAYDAEVIYHEMGHGLVAQTAGLGCHDMGVCLDDRGVNFIPNGINEGTADYFSMTYTGDPDIGEHAAQSSGEPYIRTALNGSRCPWDLIGQSHHDGHIWMGGAWWLRETLGQGAADALLFATLAALPEDAEYDVAAEVMRQAAAGLQASGVLTEDGVEAVVEMLGPQGRGMTGCSRMVPLLGRPPGYEEALAYGLPSFPGYVEAWPLTLQFRLDVPEEARRLLVRIHEQWSWDANWTVYLRRDQPVSIEVWSDWPYVEADHSFDWSPGEISLGVDTLPALVPGSTYYLAVVYSSEYDVLFGLSATLQTGPVPPVDAGLPDAQVIRDSQVPGDARRPPAYQPDSFGGRAGCACQGALSQGPFGLLALVLGLLGLALLGRRGRRQA